MESENVSPARRNASSTSTKPAISSPLKRSSIPQEPLSSPHFRPADLLGDDELGQQASLTQPNLSQQVKKASRKSLGRRVSFAATAHVRLYEKGELSEDEGGSAKKDDDLDFRPMKQPHSPLPASVISPMRPHDHENSLPSTPTSVVIGGRQPSQSPSLLRFSTIGVAPSSPTTHSSSSIGSFDVDIKDVNSSSFTSYVSGGEEEDNVTIELDQLSKDEAADMEFTGCVGGILAKADGKRKSFPHEDKDPASEMDMTLCVGGLVRQLPDSLRLYSDPAMSTGSPASSVDTMELTECVGQILARQKGQKPEMAVNDRCSSMASLNDNDTMDMTMVVRGPIVQRQASGSPSPFLVTSPPINPTIESAATPSKTAGMTFIGDIVEPEAFQMLACVSPAPNEAGEESCLSATEAADQKLFQTFIHTDRLEDGKGVQMELDDPPKQFSQLNSPKVPTSFAASNSYRQVMMSREASLESIFSTKATHNSTLPSLSQMATPNKPSSAFVSSVSSPQPVASLSEFLNETGIRFLENISSLKRRETTGRPRDSDVVAPAKQAFIATALVPQLDFYEQVHTFLLTDILSHIFLGHR